MWTSCTIHAYMLFNEKLGGYMKQPSSRSAPLNATNIDLSQKVLQKQEFGRRVYALMMEKPWTQSELARASGLGRDSISQYVRGKANQVHKIYKNLQKHSM